MNDQTSAQAGRLPPPQHQWVLLNTLAGFSWRFLVCAAALALVVMILVELSFVVVPVFIAVLLSSILSPICNALKRRGMREGRAASLTIGFVFLVIVAIAFLTIPPIIGNADAFGDALHQAADRITTILNEPPFNMSPDDAGDVGDEVESFYPQLQDTLVSGIGTIAPKVAQLVVTLGLAIVITGYLLLDGERQWRWMVGFVEEPRRPAIHQLGLEAYGRLAAYIRGTSIVAAFNAVAITLGAFLLGLPLLLPIAIIVFVAAFLPIVGAWIAAALTIFIGLASGGVSTAVAMGLVYLLVSQFKSYFISPFVVGQRVNLAPIVTLTTVMVGTVLGGIAGGIVAVPLVATVSGALGQLRRWRVEGVGGGDLIPILPADGTS